MSLRNKIIANADLAEAVQSITRPLVFTNGVFDLLHPGHALYLERARACGNSLMVGLNSDVSARQLGKGTDRPINGERDRAVMLAALESVSLVCLFDDPTPLGLIREVIPDIYVKGGDYEVDALEETKLVRGWGGDAFAIPFLDGYSTTRLVKRIRMLAQ